MPELDQDALNRQYAEEVLLPMDERRVKAEVQEGVRIEALIQLVKRYYDFVSELDPRHGYGAIRIAERNALQNHAARLLGSHSQHTTPYKPEMEMK